MCFHNCTPVRVHGALQIYDGDTPLGDRPAIRDRAQLLITNPDMLHRRCRAWGGAV